MNHKNENNRKNETVDSVWQDFAEHFPGYIGVCDVYPDHRIELNYLNNACYSFLDSSREESAVSAISGLVYSPDREYLKDSLCEAAGGENEVNVEIRIVQKAGKYKFVNVQAKTAERQSDKVVMYLMFTDVDELHHIRQQAEESRKIIQMASRDGDMAIWLYYMDTKTISQTFGDPDGYGQPLVIQEGPEKVIQNEGIHPEDVDLYREMYRKIDEGAMTSEATVRIFYKRENKYEWRRMILSRYMDEEGGGSVAIGFGVNVELQKEAEIRYERENRLRQELVKDSVIYYRINLNTKMVEELYSEAMDTSELVLPVSMEELVRNGLFEGCYAKDLPLLSKMLDLNHMQQNYESGKNTEVFTYRRYLPGKGLRWLKASITKLKRVSSDDIIAFYTAVDIDEERKDQLLYRDVLNEEIESLITMKVKDKKLRVLKENRKLPGYDPSQQKSEYFVLTEKFRSALFQGMLQEDIPQASEFINTERVVKELEKKDILQNTYRIRKEDGSVRRKKVRIFYLDESKEDIIFVRRDITDLYNEQQRQSAAIKHAMDEAKLANEAKSVFLSRMSHDMRTPLNAIIGYSGDVLREGASEEQKDEFLNDIHSSGEYLLGIINDVLDMTKIESNKMILHPESYTFEAFKESVETVIQPLCRKKEIHFEVVLPEESHISVRLDKVRFNQIFINILSNAVKFTPSGGNIEMKVLCEEKTDRQLSMTFVVADNGCGMSEEFLPHAFDSFSQEYAGQSMHNEQGTGLGLSIVKQLVELMGGTIQVASKLGQGSTFTVHMPVMLASSDENFQTDIFPENGLQGFHLLLCEDHPMNRKIAVRLLEKEGCVVDVAENGKSGVEKFEESELNHYDAILMDIRMPVMDGLEAARAIRGLLREDAGTIPIIAMTANAFVEDKRLSLDAGMNAHISKPIDTVQMYQTIYTYVSKRHVVRTPKILVVDDIEMNAALVARVLKGHYETIIALSGQEALNELKKNPYIIAVITDVQMPGMDGGELIRTIRRNSAYNQVALIANTQFGNSHMEEEMMKDGADDFIYKPTAPSLILSRVNNVLEKYRNVWR